MRYGAPSIVRARRLDTWGRRFSVANIVPVRRAQESHSVSSRRDDVTVAGGFSPRTSTSRTLSITLRVPKGRGETVLSASPGRTHHRVPSGREKIRRGRRCADPGTKVPGYCHGVPVGRQVSRPQTRTTGALRRTPDSPRHAPCVEQTCCAGYQPAMPSGNRMHVEQNLSQTCVMCLGRGSSRAHRPPFRRLPRGSPSSSAAPP